MGGNSLALPSGESIHWDRTAARAIFIYVGEQGTVAAGTQAGGNRIYGAPKAEIGMLASGIVQDAG